MTIFFLKINETWAYVYKQNFLQKKLTVCNDCRNFYYYYQKGFTDQGVIDFFLDKVKNKHYDVTFVFNKRSIATM